MSATLLKMEDLRVTFDVHGRRVRAVDGVSFEIGAGEAVGLVGESGCGKSVACASILRLVPTPPGNYEGGRIAFDGLDLLTCPMLELRRVRGKRIAMVFQDPMASLNPYLRVGDQLGEVLRVHDDASPKATAEIATQMLRDVGIADAPARMRAYPHELSGGMRQRAMLAMAMLAKPELLVADEPTTALDVTVQAQVLKLIVKARRELGMAVLLVSHDLGVIAGVSDRVIVMYAGRVVEAAPVDALFKTPRHPYTRALHSSTPDIGSERTELVVIPGQPPDPAEMHEGCAFAPRCNHAANACMKKDPVLREVAPGHATACVRAQEEGLVP